MSKYWQQPLDFAALKTVSLEARGGKVHTADFAKAYGGGGVAGWVDSLPAMLAGESFRDIRAAVLTAREKKRAIIWGLGGHVIKVGLAPVLIDLMRRGFATAFALNGASAIHDFEIALAGQTSEDVEAVLPDGSFGAAEETGREITLDGGRSVEDDPTLGYGEALGRRLQTLAKPEFRDASLLHAAYRANIPVTVHVAIGTDTPHTHPSADGAVIGAYSHRDFRLLCSLVRELDEGGVYLNVGSAVILPEVFLKAVSVVRNLGSALGNFTTVNMDFLQHYRPRMNVVERPHSGSGGRGYSLTGHHELMVPLLAAALVEADT